MAIKQEKMTLEKLAIMIKNGFDSVDERFKKVDERFKKVDERFKKVDGVLNKIVNDIEEFKKDNDKDHEDLKLRQDNAAYRFELVALSGRVERLEKVLKVESV